MKYRSTRGGSSGVSFEEAVMSGFTSDGGILMPESIPTVSSETLQSWAGLSYNDLAKEVLSLFIDELEIPREDLNALLDRAFSRFDLPEVAKLTGLADGLNILELFHGPTLAFKDLGMSCLGQFLQYFLEKRKKHITILVGTSGDTGSAALESVRGLSSVDLVVLLPKGRCTRVQELQMTTVIADNVHIYRVDGSSDDLDVPIKACFIDEAFAERHSLSSMNSINWGRILVQTIHYFYAYLKMCPDASETVEIVIPTGACGNVTAGCIAQRMGLPVHLVCAVNSNDIVARTVDRGDFSAADSVVSTLASAMDIQVPYNMERLFYLYSDHNTTLVRSLLEEMEKSGRVEVPTDIHNKLAGVISSHVSSDADILTSMKRCWQENKYLLCPHTAVAAHYHYTVPTVVMLPSIDWDHMIRAADVTSPFCDEISSITNAWIINTKAANKNMKRVCIATASPAKFEEAVTSAGLTPQPTDAVKSLTTKPTRYTDMNKGEDWEKILRSKIVAISESLAR